MLHGTHDAVLEELRVLSLGLELNDVVLSFISSSCKLGLAHVLKFMIKIYNLPYLNNFKCQRRFDQILDKLLYSSALT